MLTMNYIVEDGIDFFEEIKKKEDKQNDCCMLSGIPFTRNALKLQCGHQFNYVPLYNEIKEQKYSVNSNNNRALKVNEFICPYCRQMNTKLLPYIPFVKKITGVNAPTKHTMIHKKCRHIITSGLRKGQMCNKNGFDVESDVCMCEKHFSVKNTKIIVAEAWTEKMEQFLKSNNANQIREQLKSKGLKLSGTKKVMVLRLFTELQ